MTDTMRPPVERTLPSGRSVVVKVDGTREELEVRSPDGSVEVRITLADAGPVVRLWGARLELEAPETLALNCGRLDLHAREGASIHGGGEVRITGEEFRVQTTADVRLNGATIRLNCEEPTEPCHSPPRD